MKRSNVEMNPMHDVSPDDAIGMLVTDHKRVAMLFAEFKRLTDEGRSKEKAAVAAQICQELTVHTQLEEEIFYPAVREATKNDSQIDEAWVEHAGAKYLIAQLAGADPDDDLYDAKVTVLGEQIDHHVEEEEGSMFPKARYSGLDTRGLGAVMLARKSEFLRGASTGTEPSPGNSSERSLDAVRQPREPCNKGQVTIKKKTAKPTNPSRKSRR